MTNIKVKEILTLGGMATDYSTDSIKQRLVNDDPNACGGFVYPPGLTEYGGVFVLIPAGGYEVIQTYSDLVFNYPLVAQENSKIYILNSTGESGVAGETKQVLKRHCFDVTGFGNGNSEAQIKTKYYYIQMYDTEGNEVDSKPEAVKFLQKYIPGEASTDIPPEYKQYFSNADVILDIGRDYTESDNYMLDHFYYLDSPTHSTNPLVNFNGTALDPDLN